MSIIGCAYVAALWISFALGNGGQRGREKKGGDLRVVFGLTGGFGQDKGGGRDYIHGAKARLHGNIKACGGLLVGVIRGAAAFGAEH